MAKKPKEIIRPQIDITCCDCKAVYLDIRDKKWIVGRDPEHRGFSTWFHDCNGTGSRHRTEEIKMEADVVTETPEVKPTATPTRTRPLPRRAPAKRSARAIQAEKDATIRLPLTDSKHSYGRKISDARGRIVCWTPNANLKYPTALTEFIKEALTKAITDGVGVEDVPEEVDLPEDVVEAIKTITDHIQSTDARLSTIRDAVDKADK